MIGNPPEAGYTAIITEYAMPLRDHFHPPISKTSSWEGFHGGWPMEMVRCLLPHLPEGYVAEPRVHLGNLYELDVNAYELPFDPPKEWTPAGDAAGGLMTEARTRKLRKPLLTLEADLTEEYEYEVRIYDVQTYRKLVAAVEIVSPGNKDRPENRRAFVSKCAALLQERVCVAIVDLVTNKAFNLYAELLELIDRSDPSHGKKKPSAYAVSIRGRKIGPAPVLDLWPHELKLHRKLPILPLWLNEDLMIPLDLETSYEEACRVLRIR